MDIDQESKIIRRILSGEHEAYALLVEKYKGPVYNLASRLTGRHQDKEDLAQEIFIRAFEALERFDETKRFFPWLYTIALNVIRNHKKKKSPVPVVLELPTYTLNGSLHCADGQCLKDLLNQNLAFLPLTDVTISPHTNGTKWQGPFVVVNKEQVLSSKAQVV